MSYVRKTKPRVCRDGDSQKAMFRLRVTRALTSLGISCFALLTVALMPVLAGAQSKDQRTCINSMNKAGTKLAAAVGKEISGCISLAGAGKLIGQDVDQCMIADNNGKLTKASQKTIDTQTAKCQPPLPPYGFAGAATTNVAAASAEQGLAHAIFGVFVDSSVLVDKDGAGCQSAAAKAYEKLAAARGKAYVGCKRDGFKSGTITNADELADCTNDDVKGKVAGARTKLAETIASKCAAVSLSTAFPGCAAEADSSLALSDCIGRTTECHMCVLFEQMDSIDADCDVLDDGLLNGTCP